MREDEVGVEIDGFLVVFGGLAEFRLDEVKLGTVVVDVWVVLVLLKGRGKVGFGGIRVRCPS